MTLQLSPQIEARLTAAAHRSGIEPTALAESLLSQYLPPPPIGAVPIVDEENAAAIAQIQAWLNEEATDDPEEIRQAQVELDDLLDNLNRNRVESGERPLFP